MANILKVLIGEGNLGPNMRKFKLLKANRLQYKFIMSDIKDMHVVWHSRRSDHKQDQIIYLRSRSINCAKLNILIAP